MRSAILPVASASNEHSLCSSSFAGRRSDRPLDGLLANDKFCMIRHARLSLSHSRRRPNPTRRQTDEPTDAQTFPPVETTRHGGNDETSVEHTQGSGGTTGRPRSLGPSVPVPPAVESRKRAGP